MIDDQERRADWPIMAGLGVFALLAVACAVYAVAAGQIQGLAIPGALLVLAVGQLLILGMIWSRMSRVAGRVSEDERAIAGLAGTSDALANRLDNLEHRVANPPPSPLDDIAAEVRVLRDSVKELVRKEPRQETVPPAEAPPVQAAAKSNAERIDLLLEPVIELSTGNTLNYRAQLNLTGSGDTSVEHDDLMRKADQGGMRPALDAHALKLVAPVLRRLRLRNPGLRVFVPLGAGTLASAAAVATLEEVLRREADVASGIVFEMNQDTLASLDGEGIANLARLGRQGATMALANVYVAGLDLAALRQLGVKFLSIGAAAFDAGFGMSPAWRDFTQYARAMQFQILACGITTAQQAAAATQIARFGCGMFFAPPRKVKGDAGAAPARRHAQAA
ncbi:MAG: EAL domain-containing protein [Alphaproteobacteria bacterium]|nr:EAL domain-containing protein [Alphaproteobacteria bacterium]